MALIPLTDIQEVVLVRLEGSWSATYEHDNNRQWKVIFTTYKQRGS